jgi:uncharacterized protein YbcC (UPF0753/DUF2309 family)
MEAQLIINVALGIAGFFGAFILNSISNKIDRLDIDVRKMPQVYVTKEDNRDQLQRIEHDMNEIKQTCQLIFNKLDHKADKP